jgi:hypothetical protein
VSPAEVDRFLDRLDAAAARARSDAAGRGIGQLAEGVDLIAGALSLVPEAEARARLARLIVAEIARGETHH